MAYIPKIQLPWVTFIVARSYPGNVIGCENELPWHLRTDLQLFKNKTLHNAVIMGRKTLESIGRPLPNRLNIILSTTRNKSDIKNVVWETSKEEALYTADVFSIQNYRKELYIIGGARIYKLYEDIVQKVIVTEVFAPNIKGDAHFNVDFTDRSKWVMKYESEDFPKTEYDEYPFRFYVYHKRQLNRRFVNIRDYFRNPEVVSGSLDAYSRLPDPPDNLDHPVPEQQLHLSL
ncbi:dihydrofolate reductase [Tepidamorphus sp. 3E244]|uniref:dihydrofolate reductase n=1 Tax=Tepidamorphus sp. 3E244 TaxID=3385498 RepID=UPI0038FC789A